MQIQEFYDALTATLTYVVWDEETKDAVVIDPVLDYEPLASQTSTDHLDEVDAFLQAKDLKLHWILETHAHADHLSGSQWLRKRHGAGVVIGEKITVVQETFKNIFDLPAEFATNGQQFDRLVKDGEIIEAGRLEIRVLETPGHTPACVTYVIGDALFTGDSLLMDDLGTGRCDFPKGSAEALYDSVAKLYAFPDDTRVFVGHDYPDGRAVRCETSIGKSKRENPQLRGDTSREDFIRFRTDRDATLAPPKLIFQSVQVNVNAGEIPSAHANGIRYLRLPLNLFGPTDDLGVPVAK